MARTVSVAVLVDLEFAPDSGGHVKSWERFVQAAGRYTGSTDSRIDLTVYFLTGENDENPVHMSQETVLDIAPHVRIKTVPAVDGTRRRGLQQGAGHTDLAHFHPVLAQDLVAHDVLHVTSCFALSETAVAVARQTGAALVGSLHTHVPAFAEIYAPDVVARRLTGRAERASTRFRIARRLARIARIGLLGRRLTQRRVDRVFGACRQVLAAAESDRAALARRYPGAVVGPLGRGIDLDRFSPALRNRDWLATRFAIPPEAVVCCFVGRIDDSKGAMLAARAVARLRKGAWKEAEGDSDIRFLAIGEGRDTGAIRDMLGSAACLPGGMSQMDLARVYASSDVFLFPSRTETFGNVVLEARASGLPVVVPKDTATAGFIKHSGKDGIIVPDQKVTSWCESISLLLQDISLRQRIGQAARRDAETAGRSWDQVFAEDLLPVWAKAGRHAADAI